ncbi:MAG: hypothetical protein AAF431_09015 [Pseudomonadota bacterium]
MYKPVIGTFLISLCLITSVQSMEYEFLLPENMDEPLIIENFDFEAALGYQCDGYLTNNPQENFCSDEVPEDWQAFKFNGERIFMVPLKLSESK